MTFTFVALGATLAIAAIPNAIGVVAGDIDKYRADVERNISATGDPSQLKKDARRLRQAMGWCVALLICGFVIWLMVMTLAAGPLYVLAIADSILHHVSWWRANYNSIFRT